MLYPICPGANAPGFLNAFQDIAGIIGELGIVGFHIAFFIAAGRLEDRTGSIQKSGKEEPVRTDIAGFFRRGLPVGRIDERSDLFMDRGVFFRKIIIIPVVRIEIFERTVKAGDPEKDLFFFEFQTDAFDGLIVQGRRKAVGGFGLKIQRAAGSGRPVFRDGQPR